MTDLHSQLDQIEREKQAVMSNNENNDNIKLHFYYQAEARKQRLIYEDSHPDEKQRLTERELMQGFIAVAPVFNKAHVSLYLQARLGQQYTSGKLRAVWDLVQTERQNYATISAPQQLNVWSGTLDVATGKVRERDNMSHVVQGAPKHFIPHYESQATAPVFSKVLADLNTDENPNLGQDLLKMYAYCAFGGNRLKTMFLLYGDGDDGKSLIQNAVRRALGDYVGVVAPSKVRYSQNKDEQFQTWLANMDGRRFAMVSEWGESDRLDNALIKQIVSGGGGIVALEQKNKNEQIEIRLDFTMVIDTNFLPDVSNVEPALLKRLAVIKFNRQYADDEKDLMLDSKLEAEKAGILNMLIDAYDPDWRVPNKYRDQIQLEQAEQRVESDELMTLILQRAGWHVPTADFEKHLVDPAGVRTVVVHDAVSADLKAHHLKLKEFKKFLERQGIKMQNKGTRLYKGLVQEVR